MDACALVITGLLATWLRFGSLSYPVNFDLNSPIPYWQFAACVAIVWLAVLWIEGLYNLDRLAWDFVQTSMIARALALGLIAVILLTFALRLPGLSRGWIMLNWFGSVLSVSLGRWTLQRWMTRRHRRGSMLHRTLVVGTNAEAQRLVEALRASDIHGLVPVGYLLEDGLDLQSDALDLPVMGGAEDVLRVANSERIDAVIVASSAFQHDEIARMIADLRCAPVRTHISSGLFEVLTSRVSVHEIAGVPLISVSRIGFTPGRRALKRAFDILGAGAIVLIGLPLWVLVALGIKLSSRGPVLYRQRRVGMDGRLFDMYKFRSMIDGADRMRDGLVEANEADGPIFKMRQDPRITPFGRFIRRFSIDEFPQLINVLRGEMSLVGPRPPLPIETEEYDGYHWRRLEVPPGMTGLWQVSGRSELSFDEMVRLDLFYIENWSVGFDISLLARTIPAVLTARGAY